MQKAVKPLSHNVGTVTSSSADSFVAAFKRSPRFLSDDLKNAVRSLRVFAVYSPDAQAVLHYSDKYSECARLSASLLVHTVVVRFDPFIP